MCFNNWNNWDNWNNWYNFQNVPPDVDPSPTGNTALAGNQNATFQLGGVSIATEAGFNAVSNYYGYYNYEPIYPIIYQATISVVDGNAQEGLNFNFAAASGYSLVGGTSGTIDLNGVSIGGYGGLGTATLTIDLANESDFADYAALMSDITYTFTGTDPGTLTGGDQREIQFAVDSNGYSTTFDDYVTLYPGTFAGALTGGIASGGNGGAHPFEETGAATFANPDGASAFVASKIAGAHGVLILQADGAWDYILNPNDAAVQALGLGQKFSEVFQIQATDGATSAITINIEGSLTVYGDSANDTISGNHVVAGTGNETLDATGGNATLVAGSGKDTLNGGSGDDTLVGGTGVDKIYGNDGNDTIVFTNDLTSSDKIDGGAGTNTLVLDGDYSGGFTFAGSTMTNIQDIVLVGGNSYKLTTADANVAAGQTLTVDASELLSTDSVNFNGSKETDGSFIFVGGAGTNAFTGGAGDDVFNMANGGTDTLNGGLGNDTFKLDASLTSADRITGSGGNDIVVLDGIYTSAVSFTSTTMVGVGTLQFAAGGKYDVISNDATVAAGQTLMVDASTLGAGDSVIFNGYKEMDGSFDFLGGAGTNVFTGGAGNDTFNMVNGGIDTLTGGAGNDTFDMGAFLTSADKINGGTGNDVVVLDGDYASVVSFASTTMVNIGMLQFTAGGDYDIVANAATVASGQTLTVDASALGAGDSATFNGYKVTAGAFDFIGGAGTNIFTGGGGTDVFNMQNGGTDTLVGGAGNDIFYMGGLFTAADRINGGTGDDIVNLDGDYSAGIKFNSKTIVDIGSIDLTAGFSYKLTTNDATVAAGQTMTVDGSTLGASSSFIFNGAAETNGTLVMLGGAGNDSLTGGSYMDTFNGGGGADTLISKGGIDTFIYNAVSDSTSSAFDTITGFNAATDFFQLTFAVTVIDPAVTSGALSKSNFDGHLAEDLGAGQLGANHAVLFTPSSGSLAGNTFLVIDANGIAGYQAGQDIVIELASGTNLASLSSTNFIT